MRILSELGTLRTRHARTESSPLSVMIIMPNAVGAICGVADYSAGLGTILRRHGIDVRYWAKSLPEGDGGDHLSRGDAARWFLNQRNPVVVLHYLQFAYQRWAVQPFSLVAALLARLMRCRTVIVWHEPPADGPSISSRLRRGIEGRLMRLSDVIVCADIGWITPRLRSRSLATTALVACPIPTLLDSALTTQVTQRPFEERVEVLLFGINSRGKSFDQSIVDVVRSRLTDARGVKPTAKIVAVGTGWDRFTRSGVEPRGTVSTDMLPTALSRTAVCIFPQTAPLTARSSSVSAMLSLGIPVVATGHQGTDCPCCGYYSGAVLCLPSASAMADEVVRMLTDTTFWTARSAAGVRFYEKRLSWEIASMAWVSALREFT